MLVSGRLQRLGSTPRHTPSKMATFRFRTRQDLVSSWTRQYSRLLLSERQVFASGSHSTQHDCRTTLPHAKSSQNVYWPIVRLRPRVKDPAPGPVVSHMWDRGCKVKRRTKCLHKRSQVLRPSSPLDAEVSFLMPNSLRVHPWQRYPP